MKEKSDLGMQDIIEAKADRVKCEREARHRKLAEDAAKRVKEKKERTLFASKGFD